MTCPRNEIVNPEEQGVYHCYSRCVRRAFLCGYDALTGKNYDHRKQWVVDRLKTLSAVFFIEVLARAVMSNHNHLALRNRPDKQAEASDEEIARRWLTLFPKAGTLGVPREQDVTTLARDKQRIKVLRTRLTDISWFMRCLNERIARMANREDGVTGRFFEGRFKCTKLEDEASILACMVYVDLNEVRAKVADSPETSRFTSAYDRIEAKRQPGRGEPDWLCPIKATKDGEGIFSDLDLDAYLNIVDFTGRQQAAGKKGSIPEHLSPILERLSIREQGWFEVSSAFDKHFYRLAGTVDSMRLAAEKAGRAWFRGLASARMAFGAG